jgi:hypothetical protein
VARRLTALLPFLLAVHCGGDDTAPTQPQDARADAKNACGGDRALIFSNRAVSPGDPCGACATGVLICATPDALVCIGGADASCEAGSTTNLCGGRGVLMLDGIPAVPGQPCGPCRDGTTICAAPEIVACVGSAGAGACRDAGGDAAVVDVRPDGGLVDSVVDSAPDFRPTDAADASSPPVDGSPDAVTDDVADGRDVDSTLDSTTSDATDGDSGSINPCGGTGPLTWRGAPAEWNGRCGPCNLLRCATPTTLVCSGQIDCADGGPAERCDIPTSAYTARGPALPAPPAETAPTTTSLTTIALAANALLYNPFDFRLYASVASSQAVGGNSIAIIDPYTGTIVKSIFVGSEPKSMALSDDGQVLWVALDGAGAVRQVDLVTGTAGQQFAMGMDGRSSAWFAEYLAVLPGTHGSVAVSRYQKVSTATDDAIIYDDGVPRPYSVGPSSVSAEFVVPTHSPALLFAYNTHSSSRELSTGCVNAHGLFIQQFTKPFGSVAATLTFAENVIYSTNGVAYDIATGNTLGTFASGGPVAPDPAKRRVYFISVPFPSTTPNVTAYDMDTFLALGTESLPLGIQSTSDIRNFVRWGRYGYAFRAGSQLIAIGRSALVAGAP